MNGIFFIDCFLFSCQKPIYRRGNGEYGSLILRCTTEHFEQNPDARGNRWHIETVGSRRCIAYASMSAIVDEGKAMQILAGKLDHPSWNFMGQEITQSDSGLATLVGDVAETDFGFPPFGGFLLLYFFRRSMIASASRR